MSAEDDFKASRDHFRAQVSEIEGRMLRMTLERDRERAFFKMSVDALRTLRNRAQIGPGTAWLVESEIIGHIEHVLRLTEDIANEKRKP